MTRELPPVVGNDSPFALLRERQDGLITAEEYEEAKAAQAIRQRQRRHALVRAALDQLVMAASDGHYINPQDEAVHQIALTARDQIFEIIGR